MEKILRTGRKVIPSPIFRAAQPVYHYILAFVAALIYRFPSKKIHVVMITGTKGKSSTAEFVNAILEKAGYHTALAGTIRFKIGRHAEPNMYKMTLPGRFFLQRFLRRAVNAGCQYAVIEMTSEGAKQYRHKFIDMDSLIFLNLSPEHIESHGSYEKYVQAKLSLAEALARSSKKRKILVANADDKESPRFLAVPVHEKYPFSLAEAHNKALSDDGVSFEYQGIKIQSPFPGEFTIMNILAATTYALSQNISLETIRDAVMELKEIPGRVQKIKAGQTFDVIVDYAHTIDSLKKLYGAFPEHTKICVLGNTGGGRDTWKREGMAKVADEACDHIILTNEDPYDDDPRKIVDDMAKGVTNTPLEIIMDRREAISQALKKAHEMVQQAKDQTNQKMSKKIAVIISGKGTDPYIMAENGRKIPWSDAQVAREELAKIL